MELSKEEQEAIEFIERISKHVKKCTGCETPYLEGKIKRLELILIEKDWDIFKTVLNLIQKQSKVIDEMANIFLKTYRDWEVNRYIFQYHICSKLQNPKSEEKDCYADVWDEQSCRECIKQYFYRKVEENEY